MDSRPSSSLPTTTLTHSRTPWLQLAGNYAAIRDKIKNGASPRHVPAKIIAVADIPKTISGKIVELAVKNVVHGRPVKNTDALANPEALEQYRDRPELQD